jgi:hypothetical protein
MKRWRLHGTVGDFKVDLTLEPFTEERRAPEPSDAQRIVNAVIRVGLGGTRPPDYGKQAARAKKLLDQQPVEYWLEAIDRMRDLYPYSEGAPFDVFTLANKAHLAMASTQGGGVEELYPHEF